MAYVHRSIRSLAFLFLFIFPALVFAQNAKPFVIDPLEPTNIGLMRDALVLYHDDGTYMTQITLMLAKAQAFLLDYVQAHPHEKLAIVLDIDETALTNWTAIYASQFAYFPALETCPLTKGMPCGWDAWVKKSQATAIKPTLDFFKVARDHHVSVFFITGRKESQCPATVKNLQTAGYTMVDLNKHVFCKPHGSKDSTVVYKSGVRKKIEDMGHVIVVNVGDQDSDLFGGYALSAFKLPNPFYFVP